MGRCSNARARIPLRWISLLALTAVLATAGPTRADAVPSKGLVSLRYDVRWGPLRLFSLLSETLLGKERYEMSVTIETEGFVGWFVDWTSHSETRGLLVDDRLRPTRRTARAEYAGNQHQVAMEYGDGGWIRVEVKPDPAAEGLEPVAPELRGATIDPETATLTMIRRNADGRPCTGVERVFDGRLRYDLHLADAGTQRLELDGAVPYEGPARLCDATVDAIAGYPREDPEQWGAGMRFRYWLAPVLAGTMPLPARIDLFGQGGTLHAYLAEAHIAAPPSADAAGEAGATVEEARTLAANAG